MILPKPGEMILKDSTVISLVGSGGKTTLLYFLARKMQKKRRVLCITSTKIRLPAHAPLCETEGDCCRMWGQGNFAVAGRRISGGKIAAPPEPLLHTLLAEAELTLIEADGSKGFPVKLPAAYEPVLHPLTDTVISVAGLHALGRPIREICFRWQEGVAAAEAFPKEMFSEEHCLTEADLALLIASERGGRKQVGNRRFLAVLNQCDTELLRQRGERVLEILNAQYGVQGVLSAFLPEEREE